MRYTVLAAVIAVHLLSTECVRSGVDDGSSKRLKTSERAEVIKRAQVWKATDVSSKDMWTGPDVKGAFVPGETVTCDYVRERLGGTTPKFACAIAPDDKVKVRFGRANGEIYAGVAATRLLWALGFGADALYPVRVVCRGCPAEFAGEGDAAPGRVVFDLAAIERRMSGHELVGPGMDPGWTWPELDRVDESAGGAPVAQRDALKLLAVFLQHTDNKQEQQKLLCLDEKLKGAGSGCVTPFMTPTMVNVRSPKLAVDPIASGRPPKRRIQKSWLMMAVKGLPGVSSTGSNRRPIDGPTPNTLKNPGVTRMAVP